MIFDAGKRERPSCEQFVMHGLSAMGNLGKCLLEKERLPFIFTKLPDSVSKALWIGRPKPPQVQVTNFYEYGNVVMQAECRRFLNHIIRKGH